MLTVARRFLPNNVRQCRSDVIAQVAPHDRVVSIEDTTERQCSVKNLLTCGPGQRDYARLPPCLHETETRTAFRWRGPGAEPPPAHTMLKALEQPGIQLRATVHANDRP